MSKDCCVVVCPNFERAYTLMVKFMRQVGCKEFKKHQHYIVDMEGYLMIFTSEKFLFEDTRGRHFNYVIEEKEFEIMWGIK